MKTNKRLLTYLFISLIIGIEGCDKNDEDLKTEKKISFDDDELPGRLKHLNFDKTEKTIDYKMQNIVFSCKKEVTWFVSYTREVAGTDTLRYHTTNNENEEIEGDWYKVKIVDNK